MFGCKSSISGKFSKKLQGVGGQSSEVHERESDRSIGSVIQFLVEHGHPWTEIKSYTLSQVGVFLREANKLDDAKRKHEILSAWLGFNSDQKGIKKLIEEQHVVKNPQQQQDEHAKNWNRLSAFVKQMR